MPSVEPRVGRVWVRAMADAAAGETRCRTRVKEELRGREVERMVVASRGHDILTEAGREEGVGAASHTNRQAYRAEGRAAAMESTIENGEQAGQTKIGAIFGGGGDGRQGCVPVAIGNVLLERAGGGDNSCCGSSLIVMGGPVTTSEDMSRVMMTLAVPSEGWGHGGTAHRRAV